MRSVASQTNHGRTGGQQSVAGGGDQPGEWAEEPPRQKKNEECGGGINQEQTEMNPAGGLPEKCEDHGYAAKVPGNFML